MEWIYITPVAGAFLWRLLWWTWCSPEHATLLPDTTDDDVNLSMLAIVFWPLTVFCVVALLLVITIASPFWAVVRAIRNARLRVAASNTEHSR